VTLIDFIRGLRQRSSALAVVPDVYEWVQGRDKALFHVVSCQGDEPTDDEVAAFEAEVGFRLPPDFRRFTMSPLGGLYVEALEEVWARPKAYDVGPFWSFLYAVKVFGIASGIPEWLDIRVQTADMRAEGCADLVPFLQIEGDADRFCFDAAGRIVHWEHEEPDAPRVVDESFPSLLIREIRELEDRTHRRIKGEHR
jgi:hypothetical protein